MTFFAAFISLDAIPPKNVELLYCYTSLRINISHTLTKEDFSFTKFHGPATDIATTTHLHGHNLKIMHNSIWRR